MNAKTKSYILGQKIPTYKYRMWETYLQSYYCSRGLLRLADDHQLYVREQCTLANKRPNQISGSLPWGELSCLETENKGPHYILLALKWKIVQFYQKDINLHRKASGLCRKWD